MHVPATNCRCVRAVGGVQLGEGGHCVPASHAVHPAPHNACSHGPAPPAAGGGAVAAAHRPDAAAPLCRLRAGGAGGPAAGRGLAVGAGEGGGGLPAGHAAAGYGRRMPGCALQLGCWVRKIGWNNANCSPARRSCRCCARSLHQLQQPRLPLPARCRAQSHRSARWCGQQGRQPAAAPRT